MKIELIQVKILENNEIAPSVFVLGFERNIDFVAGQYIAVAINPADNPRLYSIASGTNDLSISILYSVNPDGELTPKLSLLKPGEQLYCSGPMGSFHATPGPSVWIAAGTGIAPFVSMWRSGMKDDIILIQGGRFLSSFYFRDEFTGTLGDSYIRCCTRENGEGIFQGRVTEWLTQQATLPVDRKYYLCGSAEMVVDTRDILIAKGIPFENIIAEIYF